jgi:hypothetical protein
MSRGACDVQVLPVSLLPVLQRLSILSLLSTARQRGIFPMLHYFKSLVMIHIANTSVQGKGHEGLLALEVIGIKDKVNNLTTFVNFDTSPLAERSATHPSGLACPIPSSCGIENFLKMLFA